MEITDVRIHMIHTGNKLKAVASVTFDDEFVVHDIKVISGQSGMFIAMPSRKMGDGDFRDIAHPLNSGFRARMKDAILSAYNEILASAQPDPGPASDEAEE